MSDLVLSVLLSTSYSNYFDSFSTSIITDLNNTGRILCLIQVDVIYPLVPCILSSDAISCQFFVWQVRGRKPPTSYCNCLVSYLSYSFFSYLSYSPSSLHHAWPRQELDSGFWYVGYRGWLAIWGGEAWEDGNTNNGDGWKQIGSVLRSGSPSSFWFCSSSVSPLFGEQSQFLLELELSRSGPDRSWSVCQKWGNGIKEGTEDRDGGSHPR